MRSHNEVIDLRGKLKAKELAFGLSSDGGTWAILLETKNAKEIHDLVWTCYPEGSSNNEEQQRVAFNKLWTYWNKPHTQIKGNEIIKKVADDKDQNTDKKDLKVISFNDQAAILRLLKILDIKFFQEDINEQDAWYGYTKESIGNMLDFIHESRLLKNKILNKELHSRLQKFLKALDKFDSLCSKSVFGANEIWYRSIYADYDPEKRKEVSVKLNKLTTSAFKELDNLIVFLKENNIEVE